MVERLTKQNQSSVVLVQTYTVLKPGSTSITFGLRNISARKQTSRSAIAKFMAANAIPDTLAPHIDEKEDGEKPINKLP